MFIGTSIREMMSIEVSLDFESPRILVSKTSSDPLLVMGMVRPQEFVTSSSECVNSSEGEKERRRYY